MRRWVAILLPWLGLLPLVLLGRVPPATAANAVVQLPCDNAAFSTALATVQNSGGGTLTFNCGAGATLFITEKLITAPVTIDGAGQVQLSGSSKYRLFNVQPTGRLTLRDITVCCGYASGDGGAIVNEGALILDRAVLTGSVSGQSGGALISFQALTITNSIFENNEAVNGGALYLKWDSSRANIAGATFRHNNADATGWGGAILVFDGAQATITGGEFFSNTANYGGAVFNDFGGVPSRLWIADSALLRENEAFSGGGALYNEAHLTLTAAALHGNYADSGGGIMIDSTGRVVIQQSELARNRAAIDGGGIYNTGILTLA
jgi:hypothetical protein